jgi:hypothetical protein
VPRPPIRTKPAVLDVLAGPLRGVRDSQRPGTPDPSLAEAAFNMRRVSGPQGSGLAQRAGFSRMGISEDAWQTVGLPQAVLSWINASGVRQTTLVAAGILYEYNWATSLWESRVSSANLTTASVTLSATAPRVSLVPFAGKLCISDGINRLIVWDGAAGAGGISQVPNVGPFYGPLTVYYAKLFGILANSTGAGPRGTLVWSEENDPTLGYDVAPYNNAWDRPGGQTEPLTAVAGTNEALYVFRGRSTIAVTGAVNQDFQTAGTRANVSAETGTFSPWSVAVRPQGVWFVDHEAAPHIARYGAEDVIGLGDDCKRTTDGITSTVSLELAWTVYDDAHSTLLVFVPDEVNTNTLTRALAFAASDLQYVGTWRWALDASGTRAVVNVVGEVVDADGHPRIAFGVGGTRVALGGTPDSGPWADADGIAANVPVTASVTGPLQAYDWRDEVRVDRIEASIPNATCETVSVSYSTSRGSSTPINVPVPGLGGGFVVNQDQVNGPTLLGNAANARRRGTAFVAGRGRGVQWTVSHAQAGKRFALDAVRMRLYGVAGNVNAP